MNRLTKLYSIHALVHAAEDTLAKDSMTSSYVKVIHWHYKDSIHFSVGLRVPNRPALQLHTLMKVDADSNEITVVNGRGYSEEVLADMKEELLLWLNESLDEGIDKC